MLGRTVRVSLGGPTRHHASQRGGGGVPQRPWATQMAVQLYNMSLPSKSADPSKP